MLSVLIPVKDWNPENLVEALASQLIQTGLPYEILVSDDSMMNASAAWSGSLIRIPGVEYFSREQPLGRSANRNFLGNEARYQYLLFIDGDAAIVREDFVQTYIDHMSPDLVLCGGTLYEDHPPQNPDNLLRWKYGRSREQTAAAKRQRRPRASFSTFNFLVPATIFRSIRFDESIRGYGHEDTIFGINLHQSGVRIVHLDNGLVHLGLESAAAYLEKIRESAACLAGLQSAHAIPPGYAGDIRLLASWLWIRRLKIAGLVAMGFNHHIKRMERNLCGPDPSLLLLDLYKLGAICQFT